MSFSPNERTVSLCLLSLEGRSKVVCALMAKFSLSGGEEDGDEGPSFCRFKRSRSNLIYDSSSPSSSEDAPEPQRRRQSEAEEAVAEDDQIHGDDDDDEDFDLSHLGSERLTHGGKELDADDPRSLATNTDGSISVRLTDPDVLDCCICFEPLTIPVFQCENGHIACCSCCTKLSNKCPSCSWPIGYNRCRAIEKVLESIKVECQNKQYGCKEAVTYSKKKDHEKTCTYSPCPCPLSCNFVSSSEQLYLHFSRQHSNSAVRFHYNSSFSITLDANDKFCILQEQKDNVLFILNQRLESLGNVVWISCIWACSHRGFNYNISAKNEDLSLTLQSTTMCTQSRVDNLPPTGFLLIPSDFLGTPIKLKLHLQIFKDSPVPECSKRSINSA